MFFRVHVAAFSPYTENFNSALSILPVILLFFFDIMTDQNLNESSSFPFFFLIIQFKEDQAPQKRYIHVCLWSDVDLKATVYVHVVGICYVRTVVHDCVISTSHFISPIKSFKHTERRSFM